MNLVASPKELITLARTLAEATLDPNYAGWVSGKRQLSDEEILEKAAWRIPLTKDCKGELRLKTPLLEDDKIEIVFETGGLKPGR